MVFRRLLLQVALGVLGLWPCQIYPGGQRVLAEDSTTAYWTSASSARSGSYSEGGSSGRSASTGGGGGGSGSHSSDGEEAAPSRSTTASSSRIAAAPVVSSNNTTPHTYSHGFFASHHGQEGNTAAREHSLSSNGGSGQYGNNSASDAGEQHSRPARLPAPSDADVERLYELLRREGNHGFEHEEFRGGLSATGPTMSFLHAVTEPQIPEEAGLLAAAFKSGHVVDFLARGPLSYDGGQFPIDPQFKRCIEHEDSRLVSSALTMCGRRRQDEDAVVVHARLKGSPLTVKGLFDGHGGVFASHFCSKQLHHFLQGIGAATPEALKTAFLTLDTALLSHHEALHSGSTGVVALIEDLEEPRDLLVAGREVLLSPSTIPLQRQIDVENGRVQSSQVASSLKAEAIRLGGLSNRAFLVTIANIGDSRATLLHADGTFTILSRDHKPSDPEEVKRIERAGGFVTNLPNSVPRVDNVLAVSRAFGDGALKQSWSSGQENQKVIAVPDVHTFFALPGDILMLACDGMVANPPLIRPT